MLRRLRSIPIFLTLAIAPATTLPQRLAAQPPELLPAPAAMPGTGNPFLREGERARGQVDGRYAVPVAYEAYTTSATVVPAVPIERENAVEPGSTMPPAPQPIAQPVAEISALTPLPTGGKFGLDRLVELATTSNPILDRERARVEAAKGGRVQAGLYENPIMFTNNPEVFSGQFSFVNVGFKQNVVVKGKKRLDRAAADQGVRRSAAELQLERAEMITEVRKQFYKTVAAKHRVYLARHLAEIAGRGVAGARQLAQAGEGTETDVLLLDTEYQRAQIRLENAETIYRGELKQLAAVVGAADLVIDDVSGTLFEAPPEFDERNVRAFLTEGSSHIERARADLTQKQIELRRAEVDPYPDLQLGPHMNTGTVQGLTQYWFTVEFQIPVWNLNQGNIRQRNAEVHKSIEQRQVTVNELNRNVSELFAEHRAARERAEQIRVKILPNAQRTQAIVQDAYLKGQFNVNRLLQSQRNLAEVSSDYFDAAEKSWTTAAEIGGLLQLEQFP
jgi:cobalt-zinc-cadmium efflux system outer membrane protein